MTIYQLRYASNSDQPTEHGQIAKEFTSRKELNDYWETRSDRHLLCVTTRQG